MYGLDTEDIEAIKKVFSKHFEIETAILYGSRAKGNYRNDSDIDLTLKGEKITLSQLFEIETELDDILLPYKIDLSVYHKIENPDFIEHIKRVGIIFYENETNKWKETTLDNHIDLISGYAFKSKDFLENQEEGTLPIIKIKNVANGDVNLKDVVFHNYDESLSKYVLSKNDVLIAMTGNHPQAETQVVGDVSRFKLDVSALLNQRVGKIVPKGKTDLNFLYYFFKDKDTHRYLANQSSGSANQANISKTNIIGLETEFPDPIEQKAISTILVSLDDKIDLLQDQNKTLEAMAETLFRQWFVEEADNDWEEGVLDEGIEILDNLRIPLSKIERNKKKEGKLYPYYGAAKIMDYVNDYIFDGDYILLGEDGTVTTAEGYPILQYATGKFWVNNHTHVIKAKHPFNNFFIWNYLLKKNITEIITGAVQPKINQGNLKSLDFPKFPIKLVTKFNEISSPLFKKINQNNDKILTLEDLRNTLLPKLMSGEVKVIIDD